MRQGKLTLSVDRELIEEAKKLAKKEGTSISSMFARFLETLLGNRGTKDRPGPLTRRATGLVELPADRTDRELLEEALAERFER